MQDQSNASFTSPLRPGGGLERSQMDILNASANQASMTMLDYEDRELCELHKGEIMIAVDVKDPTLYGCNKCVFERKLERPRFLVTEARRTKKTIDEHYNRLVTNLEEIEKLEPNAFQSKVQDEVSNYFSSVYKQIKEVEKHVINQIKSSQNLKLLREALEALH